MSTCIIIRGDKIIGTANSLEEAKVVIKDMKSGPKPSTVISIWEKKFEKD